MDASKGSANNPLYEAAQFVVAFRLGLRIGGIPELSTDPGSPRIWERLGRDQCQAHVRETVVAIYAGEVACAREKVTLKGVAAENAQRDVFEAEFLVQDEGVRKNELRAQSAELVDKHWFAITSVRNNIQAGGRLPLGKAEQFAASERSGR